MRGDCRFFLLTRFMIHPLWTQMFGLPAGRVWLNCSSEKAAPQTKTSLRPQWETPPFASWSQSFSYKDSCTSKPLLQPSCQRLYTNSILHFVTIVHFLLCIITDQGSFYCLQTSIPEHRRGLGIKSVFCRIVWRDHKARYSRVKNTTTKNIKYVDSLKLLEQCVLLSV